MSHEAKDFTGEELDINVTDISCDRCHESCSVHGDEQGMAFAREHAGHTLTYCGRIVEPAAFAGFEVTFQMVAPDANVH